MGNKVNGNGVGRRESLRKKDLETLMQHFQLDKETISIIVNHFEMQTDLEMDKAEFLALYSKITHTDSNNEGFKLLSDKIFDIFDADNSGTVSFHEFLLGYKLTTSGELKTKIQLTFELYDTDKDGYLDKEEVNTIVRALMTMLGNEDDSQEAMAEIQFLLLDRNNDGKISMDEFVDGLTMNNNLRLLMSPFV